MSQEELDISVIIATYTEDRWRHLVNGVESRRQQTIHAREIIVIVDGNPGLLERIRRELPDVVTLENFESTWLIGSAQYGNRLWLMASLSLFSMTTPRLSLTGWNTWANMSAIARSSLPGDASLPELATETAALVPHGIRLGCWLLVCGHVATRGGCAQCLDLSLRTTRVPRRGWWLSQRPGARWIIADGR